MAAIFTIVAVFLAIRIIMFFLGLLKEKRNHGNSPVKTPPRRELLEIKKQYIFSLQTLLKKYDSGNMGKRDAYQKMSLLIRGFVHEATGINVENHTKLEIRGCGLKNLDMLMEEYYIPEFAEDEKARNNDFKASCNKTLGVIKAWR